MECDGVLAENQVFEQGWSNSFCLQPSPSRLLMRLLLASQVLCCRALSCLPHSATASKAQSFPCSLCGFCSACIPSLPTTQLIVLRSVGLLWSPRAHPMGVLLGDPSA